MAKLQSLTSRGPNGEEPNVHACPCFYHEEGVLISAYVVGRHTFTWVAPPGSERLSGFKLKGPAELIVREIWIGIEQILSSPQPLSVLAPEGLMELSREVRPFTDLRMEFGA